MRLVVSYVSGDGYECSCDENLPFEYESAERLLVDLEDLANKFKAFDAEKQAAWQAFRDKHDRRTNPEEWLKEHEALSLKYSHDTAPWTLKSGDVELYVRNFIRDHDNQFEAPQIYTVDEWFAAYSL